MGPVRGTGTFGFHEALARALWWADMKLYKFADSIGGRSKVESYLVDHGSWAPQRTDVRDHRRMFRRRELALPVSGVKLTFPPVSESEPRETIREQPFPLHCVLSAVTGYGLDLGRSTDSRGALQRMCI